MSKLRDILVERYDSHYRIYNADMDPRRLGPKEAWRYDAMFGRLLTGLPAGDRVLDLGCGAGYFVYWLSTVPGITPVGVDASEAMVLVGKEALPDAELHVADGLEYLEAHEGEFAGTFCFDVLEDIPGDDLLLEWVRAANRALKPGGFFCCRTPNGAHLFSGYSRYMDLTHERCLTSSSMRQLLDAAEFERCTTVPYRTKGIGGRLRLALEAWIHKLLLIICGYGRVEKVYTNNVWGLGYRSK